eukprot:3424631-Amphidinium_carterae.1
MDNSSISLQNVHPGLLELLSESAFVFTSTGYDLIFDSCRVLYLVRKWHAPLSLTCVLLARQYTQIPNPSLKSAFQSLHA